MIDTVSENIMAIGPVFTIIWLLTIILTLWRPQQYFNSILLMVAIMVTMVFISGFFGDYAGAALFICFILVMIALLLVPVMLIINGIQMIRKESVCLAHLLSLGLGIFVGVGEIATFIYVFGFYSSSAVQDMSTFLSLVICTVFYFSCLVLSFVIYSIFIQIMPHRRGFNYVIIHGCGLRDGEHLSKLLSNRVDKAIEVYNKCRVKPILIPSGGKGSDEKLSEAQAMKNYLLEKGIPEDHILLEDRSTTTEENLRYSKEIIDSRSGKKRTALVSSNYHVYRCLRLAKKIGFDCTGIGAKVALYFWPSALIREFIAIFLTKGFLIWSIIGYLIFISPFMYVFFG